MCLGERRIIRNEASKQRQEHMKTLLNVRKVRVKRLCDTAPLMVHRFKDRQVEVYCGQKGREMDKKVIVIVGKGGSRTIGETVQTYSDQRMINSQYYFILLSCSCQFHYSLRSQLCFLLLFTSANIVLFTTDQISMS